MRQSLARKRSSPSKQSETSSVSSREGRNPVKNRRYEQTLAAAGIFMDDDDKVAITDACKVLCRKLLETNQPMPEDSLFNDSLFKRICQRVRNRNEARVVRDLSPLLVPSAEILHVRGATKLEHLLDNVDESWSNCIPLVSPRPKPDFSVGLKPTAFTSEQLKKLKPYVGDGRTASRFVATDEMYFPFLTSEVKCGNEALNIADRQNAHSASVAANAVVELYRAVSRQDELQLEILAFSVSHDNEAVRIYGHYPLIEGQKISFYRHPIKKFDFTSEDGRERWTAYKFTRNVYDIFVPLHLRRICAAIVQLPDSDVFDVQPLSQQFDVGSAEHSNSQLTASYSQDSVRRLSSSQTSEPAFKKAR